MQANNINDEKRSKKKKKNETKDLVRLPFGVTYIYIFEYIRSQSTHMVHAHENNSPKL